VDDGEGDRVVLVDEVLARVGVRADDVDGRQRVVEVGEQVPDAVVHGPVVDVGRLEDDLPRLTRVGGEAVRLEHVLRPPGSRTRAA
jgi:methyl coenzyme M reductase subunit D